MAIASCKLGKNSYDICQGKAGPIQALLSYALGLGFDEKPNYKYIIEELELLLENCKFDFIEPFKPNWYNKERSSSCNKYSQL